jgi:hypothetical protein
MLAGLDGRPAGALEEHSAQVLADVPDAARWAEGFTGELSLTPKAFRRRSAPSIVSCAIMGIAQACIPDPDTMLHDLLVGAIDDCRAWCGADLGAIHVNFDGAVPGQIAVADLP